MRLCFIVLIGLLLLRPASCQEEEDEEKAVQMRMNHGVDEAKAGTELFDINMELEHELNVDAGCMFRFRLKHENVGDTSLFSVNENNWLVARHELDYEAGGAGTSHVRTYSLHLDATLVEGDQIECQVERFRYGIMLSFDLLDVNDNPPLFSVASAALNFSARDPIGRAIPLPAATDADSPANGIKNHTIEWTDAEAASFFRLENATRVPPSLAISASLLTASKPIFEGRLVAYDTDYRHNAKLPIRISIADLPPKTTAAPPTPPTTPVPTVASTPSVVPSPTTAVQTTQTPVIPIPTETTATTSLPIIPSERSTKSTSLQTESTSRTEVLLLSTALNIQSTEKTATSKEAPTSTRSPPFKPVTLPDVKDESGGRDGAITGSKWNTTASGDFYKPHPILLLLSTGSLAVALVIIILLVGLLIVKRRRRRRSERRAAAVGHREALDSPLLSGRGASNSSSSSGSRSSRHSASADDRIIRSIA